MLRCEICGAREYTNDYALCLSCNEDILADIDVALHYYETH